MADHTPDAIKYAEPVSHPDDPEWFIGGPLDGQRRINDAPSSGTIRAVVDSASDASNTYGGLVDYWDDSYPTPDTVTYTRRPLAVGLYKLTVWIVDGMDEMEAATRVMELLLRPHRATPPMQRVHLEGFDYNSDYRR